MIADRYYEESKGEVNGTSRRANIEDVHEFEELDSKIAQWESLSEAEKLTLKRYFDQIFLLHSAASSSWPRRAIWEWQSTSGR
jgi:hypothetical protein